MPPQINALSGEYGFKPFGVRQWLTPRALRGQSQLYLRTTIASCKTSCLTVAEIANSAPNTMGSVVHRNSNKYNFSLLVI